MNLAELLSHPVVKEGLKIGKELLEHAVNAPEQTAKPLSPLTEKERGFLLSLLAAGSMEVDAPSDMARDLQRRGYVAIYGYINYRVTVTEAGEFIVRL